MCSRPRMLPCLAMCPVLPESGTDSVWSVARAPAGRGASRGRRWSRPLLLCLRWWVQIFFSRPTGMSNPCSRSWLAQLPIVPVDLPYLAASALNEPTAARSVRNSPRWAARHGVPVRPAPVARGGRERGDHGAVGQIQAAAGAWPPASSSAGSARPTTIHCSCCNAPPVKRPEAAEALAFPLDTNSLEPLHTYLLIRALRLVAERHNVLRKVAARPPESDAEHARRVVGCTRSSVPAPCRCRATRRRPGRPVL
jgi:hypothetical protein